LALAALALVVFGAYDSYPLDLSKINKDLRLLLNQKRRATSYDLILIKGRK